MAHRLVPKYPRPITRDYKLFSFSAHSTGPHADSVSGTSLPSMTCFGVP